MAMNLPRYKNWLKMLTIAIKMHKHIFLTCAVSGKFWVVVENRMEEIRHMRNFGITNGPTYKIDTTALSNLQWNKADSLSRVHSRQTDRD